MITQAEFESFKESIDSFLSEYMNASVAKITNWSEYEKTYRLKDRRKNALPTDRRGKKNE